MEAILVWLTTVVQPLWYKPSVQIQQWALLGRSLLVSSENVVSAVINTSWGPESKTHPKEGIFESTKLLKCYGVV